MWTMIQWNLKQRLVTDAKTKPKISPIAIEIIDINESKELILMTTQSKLPDEAFPSKWHTPTNKKTNRNH